MLLKNIQFKLISNALLVFCLCANAHSIELREQPKLQAIADDLIANEYYTQDELAAIFENAKVQQSVLDAMKNPAEYKYTWGKYRKLFLKSDRIQQGVEFWNEHQADLDRAESEFGVPASVIVAIIGVESKFGRFKGSHKVIDSLVSLTVDYPRRSKFFANELKEFLILSKENGLQADQILGSYAGAVGYPQFISSSYRNFAVDFSGDGKVDLINQAADAIGSVANYFIKNGWKPGEAVTSAPIVDVEEGIINLANRKRKTLYSVAQLRQQGANISMQISEDEKLNVLMLDASEIVSNTKGSDTYIVRAGDTACQIAEKFKISCKLLFSINKLDDNGRIFRGQRLKLPSNARSSSVQEKDQSKPVYFYTHRNFYAITQYNHSVLYAMAVHDLSIALASAKKQYDQSMQSTGVE